MSESDNEFDIPTESTRLMDGHVATTGGSGEVCSSAVVNPHKRRSKTSVAQTARYTEVTMRIFIVSYSCCFKF